MAVEGHPNGKLSQQSRPLLWTQGPKSHAYQHSQLPLSIVIDFILNETVPAQVC